MEFDIPDPGVYLLTGSNGSGKTTLLTALHRLGFGNAFAHFFKTTTNEDKLDSYGNAEINYTLGKEEVTYKYGNTRWAPTPKKNSHILSKFGFPQVKFIAADAKRIEATQDELKANRISSTDDEIRMDLKSILSDEKFSDLKYINTKRGNGNRAYLISKKVKGKICYFSEKNFSLGELCVLRLVTGLKNISYNSLVLIDEIEMALYPKAQVALFNYLSRVAKEKNLTIIFSTHSASLIKRASRRNILLLKRMSDGTVNCLRNVYPAQALGDIAYDDEISPDFLFFVEDYKAKQMLEDMIEKYKSNVFDTQIPPKYKVVPVGGFKETIEFLTNSDQIFGDNVKRYAFLDKDVETESVAEAKKNEKYDFLSKIKSHNGKIKYLPCTPEQGIVNLIESNIIHHSKEIGDLFPKHHVDVDRILDTQEYRDIKNDNLRKKAKHQFSHIIDDISRRTGLNPEQCSQVFSYHYVNHTYNDIGKLKQIFSPIFNGK